MMQSEQEQKQRYLAHIIARYGTVTLPIALPINAMTLQAIFQPLELRRNPLIIEDMTPERRRKLAKEDQQRDEDEKKPVIALSAADALQQSATRRLVILGGPGSGKTTLLKDLLCQAAAVALEAPAAPLPIFLSLPDLARAGGSLLVYLANVATASGVAGGFQTFLWKAITSGNAFLCLDSLDEVAPLLRPAIITLIDRDAPSWGGVCVVGSRFTEYKGGQFGHESFAEWEIKPLDHALRIELAQRLMPVLADKNASSPDPMAFVAALETHPQAQSWGENPLLFSLAAVVYAPNGMLPASRSVLYGDIIAAVLVTRQPDPMRRQRLSRIIGEMALRLYQVKGRTFTRAEMLVFLRAITSDLYLDEDAFALMHAIIASGLLEVVAHETYGFRHQTFQEYMVASALAYRLTSSDTTIVATTKDFIWSKRTFSRWTEVLRLLVGILIHAHEANGAALAAWWLQTLVGQRETGDGDVGLLGLTLALTSLSEAADAPTHWQEGPATTVATAIVHAWAATTLIYDDFNIKQRLEAMERELRYLPPAGITAGLTPLLVALGDGPIAIKAIDVLDKLGEQLPIAPLVAAMHDGQTRLIRARAACALAAHGVPIAYAEIAAYLNGDDYGVYEWSKQIAIALIQHGDRAILNRFVHSLNDDEPHVRSLGYEILMRAHQATVALLLQGLADPNHEVREHIEMHFYSLKKYLSSEEIIVVVSDPHIRRKPLSLLSNLGPSIPITIFTDALQSDDASIRRDAVSDMRYLGDRMPIALLVTMLQDVDAYVRAGSAKSLGSAGAHAPIAALLPLLQDPDDNVRDAAASALGDLGDHVPLAIILEGMASVDGSIREGLVNNLKKRHDRIPTAALLTFLGDQQAHVRQVSCEIVGMLGDPHVIDLLTPLLGDPYWEVRTAAVTALTQLGEPGKHVSPERLLADFTTCDAGIKTMAATILGEARATATIELLLKTLHETKHGELRHAIILALGQMEHDTAMQALLTLLDDPDPWVRQEAVRGLWWNYGERVPLEPLFAAMQDVDEAVRYQAYGCLVATGRRMPLDFIVAAINDTDVTVHCAAIKALGDFGAAAPIAPLLAALQFHTEDEYAEQEMYTAAATSLSKIKERVPLDMLLTLFGDGELPSSPGAVVALNMLDIALPLDLLLRAAYSSQRNVRAAMVERLGQQGENTPIDFLLEALHDPEPQVVLAAAAALGMVHERVPVALLLAQLQSSDALARRGAACALGRLGEHTPIVALLPLLDDPSTKVAAAAISALGELRQPQAIEPLLHALDTTTSNRIAIAKALITICGPEHVPERVVTRLLQGLQGKSHERWAAGAALIDLGIYAPIAPFLKDLGDTDDFIYVAALRILRATHAEVFVDLVPEATMILRDGQAGTLLGSRLRTQMANAIGAMKRVPPLLFDLLTDLLDWHYPETRRAAATALGKIQHNIPDATIRKLLVMRQGTERDSAEQALAAILSLETGIEDD